MIWSLLKQASLNGENVYIPRPRTYRKQLAKLASQFGSTSFERQDLFGTLPLDYGEPEQDLHIVLKITDLMEPAQNFCPAGDWFFNLGQHAARYRSLLAPSEMKFMISLCNPAMLVSSAWSSGNYSGFDVIPPDPFALKWANILSDLRKHCSDVPIIAWSAEDAPMVWGQVLDAAVHPVAEISVAAEIHLAKHLMNNEGIRRLTEYLEQHKNMPRDKRARIISIFLNAFPQKDAQPSEVSIPDWDKGKQDRMDAQYAADLAEVAKIEGVTLIRA